MPYETDGDHGMMTKIAYIRMHELVCEYVKLSERHVIQILMSVSMCMTYV